MINSDDIQLQLLFFSFGALRGRMSLLPSRIITKKNACKFLSSEVRNKFCGNFHVCIFFPYHFRELSPGDRKPWVFRTLWEYQWWGIRHDFLSRWRRGYQVVNGQEILWPGPEDFPRVVCYNKTKVAAGAGQWGHTLEQANLNLRTSLCIC